MNHFLSRDTSLKVLSNIQRSTLPFVYDYEKHRIIISDEKGEEIIYFRLPIVFPPPAISGIPDDTQVNYLILLIQSGSCAIGYFENGHNLDHKVFRAYMVRMKQGKSQVKYLKTKGKSRAGSRVRLAETVEFFENINQRLRAYAGDYPIHRIAISWSKILIPYFFQSKVTPPFDKHDSRLFYIPRHIHTPNYEILLDTNKFLLKGELIYDERHQDLVNILMGEGSAIF